MGENDNLIKWGIYFVIGFLLFWFVFSDSDTPAQETSKNTSTSTSKKLTITQNQEDVLANIKKTIVWVSYDMSGKEVDGTYFENRGGTGSGVIVSNKDNELRIYTNRHVVDCNRNDIECFQRIAETIQVRTQDGKMHKVDSVSFSNSDVDLARLTINTNDALNYPFVYYTEDVKIGDKVIAVGYPAYIKNMVEFSVSKGEITNIKEVLASSSGFGFKTIESDAYTYFGSSGGGLFSSQGNLVGITTWGNGEQSVAIDFSSIQQDSFIACPDGSYFYNGKCYYYCERDQVMDNDRYCYDVCTNYY